MKRLRWFSFVLIAANFILAVGHLLVVEKMLPGPEYKVSWIWVGLMALGHLIVASTLKLSKRWAGGILVIFWSAALAAGIYWHLLQLAPNNGFRSPAGGWTSLFDTSVFALLAVEAAGLWLAIRLLGSGQNLKMCES